MAANLFILVLAALHASRADDFRPALTQVSFKPAPPELFPLEVIVDEPAPTQGLIVFDKDPSVYTTAPESRPIAFQPPEPPDADPQAFKYDLKLELPGPAEIFGRLDSEPALQQRLRQRILDTGPAGKFEGFPDEPVVSREDYTSRCWPLHERQVEPVYVAYDRMFFEEKNSERYGWDIGILQPAVSTGTFYADIVKVPYDFFSQPCRMMEAGAGYCLPGDPTPKLLYPPGASLMGTAGEAAVIFGLLVLF